MILINGESSRLTPGETVAGALVSLGIQGDARGVAVAVDGEVVRRAEWRSFEIPDGARVEVLTAMQGG